MFKFLINTVKSAIEQEKTQSRLNILIGQKKKVEKLNIPAVIKSVCLYDDYCTCQNEDGSCNYDGECRAKKQTVL